MCKIWYTYDLVHKHVPVGHALVTNPCLIVPTILLAHKFNLVESYTMDIQLRKEYRTIYMWEYQILVLGCLIIAGCHKMASSRIYVTFRK